MSDIPSETHKKRKYFVGLIAYYDVSSEKSWLEFKHNNCDPKKIGVLCSAISNSARIWLVKMVGYVVWGVSDSDKSILGTNFDPDSKTIGNQVLELWLAQQLTPSLNFKFDKVTHPEGEVVLLEIPAATSAPVSF